MIQSTKGKRAANVVQGKYGKGFPSDLVKRSRAMLTALDAAVEGADKRLKTLWIYITAMLLLATRDGMSGDL